MSFELLNIALWLLGGAALGALAYALLNANAVWSLALNMLIGSLGAVGAGSACYLSNNTCYLSNNLWRLADGAWMHFSATAFAAALAGALLCLGILTAVSTVAVLQRRDHRTRILLH